MSSLIFTLTLRDMRVLLSGRPRVTMGMKTGSMGVRTLTAAVWMTAEARRRRMTRQGSQAPPPVGGALRLKWRKGRRDATETLSKNVHVGTRRRHVCIESDSD